MAGTNRNRKLALNEAWKHYWPILFPAGIDWRADLEAAIRKRLYFPANTSQFLDAGKPDVTPPHWARELEIRFEENKALITFKKTDFGPIHLFTDQVRLVLNNWQEYNPLARASIPTDMTDRNREQCRDIIIAAVGHCGNIVRNRLLSILKETVQPKFEIFCRPSGDVFSKEKQLPEFGLTEIIGVDITKNELTGSLRLPKFSYVRIKLRRPSISKAGPRGSFHETDAALVENMKTWIDQGSATSVLQAAKMALPNAARRRGSLDASVVRRLQDAFTQKYPNYVRKAYSPAPR